jgi:hypothetical protein
MPVLSTYGAEQASCRLKHPATPSSRSPDGMARPAIPASKKLTVMGRGLHPREYRVAGIRVRPRDHRKRDPMRKGLRVGLSSVSWEGSSRSLLCPRSRVITAIIGTIGAVGGGYIGRAIDVVPRRRAGRLPPGRGGAVGLLLAYRPFRRRPARLRPRPNAACAAWALGITWLSIDRRLKSLI